MRSGELPGRSVIACVALAAGALAAGCAPRPASCSRACDLPFTCASGECVRPETVPAIEARAHLGDYQARRLVLAPADVARLAPGDDHGEVSATAVLGRDGDARAMLLLRFAIDLPPGTSIVEAHVLLDRTSPADEDPAPLVLHAARIQDRWDAPSLSWGRAPRVEEGRLASTTIDAPRREVRIDVRPLVRAWREPSNDDQGIALIADSSTRTGATFALADGAGSSEHAAPPIPSHASHAPGGGPLFVTTESSETLPDLSTSGAILGPRLELYVKP